MNGPEHYRVAEFLLDAAIAYDKDGAPTSAARCRTEATVHATLALVAATVTAAAVASNAADLIPSIDLRMWEGATRPTPVKDDEAEAGEDA